MTLASQAQNRLTMGFAYFRVCDGREELVARGEQQVACMVRDGDSMLRPRSPASSATHSAPSGIPHLS